MSDRGFLTAAEAHARIDALADKAAALCRELFATAKAAVPAEYHARLDARCDQQIAALRDDGERIKRGMKSWRLEDLQ
jgi:hypothetical protein